MATFALKVRDDDPVALFLAKQENKSEFLRALVQAYLDGNAGKPAINRRAPEAPAPTSGLTAQDMEDALYNALVRAKNNLGIQVTFGGGQEKAPLNQEPAKNGKLPPPGKQVDKGVTGRFVDDDGGAEPLDYATESPDEILSSMGMA